MRALPRMCGIGVPFIAPRIECRTMDGGSSRMRSFLSIGIVLATLACCAGCVPPSAVREDVPDHFERLNRGVYKFNRALDKTVVRPVARGYARFVPAPVDRHMRNFFTNLGAPIDILNNFLQAKFKPGFSDFGRFLLNTVAGAGFFDPAGKLGLERHEEDFGQTLAVWGVPSGGPLMLPILGMGTVRDWEVGRSTFKLTRSGRTLGRRVGTARLALYVRSSGAVVERSRARGIVRRVRADSQGVSAAPSLSGLRRIAAGRAVARSLARAGARLGARARAVKPRNEPFGCSRSDLLFLPAPIRGSRRVWRLSTPRDDA